MTCWKDLTTQQIESAIDVVVHDTHGAETDRDFILRVGRAATLFTVAINENVRIAAWQKRKQRQGLWRRLFG